MVTISTPSTAPQSGSIVPIDMSKLTQSDLQTLSLTSSILSSERLFIPTIDRSLFNESAGSLRQTYSHHESSPSTGVHQHRNRFAGLVRASEAPEADEDPVRRENMSILKILRNYINSDLFSQNIDLMTPSLSAPVGLDRERKRKRGKVPIHAETENVDLLEIKNKHGIEIDVEALSGLVDPYSEELRRRTEGLVTEEELLGFFRGLGGEWGSRRKKRKIVDAGIFGDLLPVGWKLLLGLRRREGRISVYCRRYVSPAGQQFISCTEISSYMQSYLRLKDASKSAAQSRDGIQQVFKVDSENNAVAAEKDDSQSAGIIDSSSGTSRSLSRPLVKEVVKSGVENWTQDVFECRKCNINFPEQDAYLEHLLSLHQRATRKYRLGSSVGDGVIMKNGKFECQFCHKVFDERRRYNGHVGIHVRDYVRRNGESPAQGSGHSNLESSSRNCFPPNFSKMNALLEIAQCSILETSTNEENGGGLSGVPAHGKPNHDSFESLPDATPKDGKSSRKVKGFYVESFSTANREGEVKLGHMRMEEIEVGKTPDEDFAVDKSIAIVKAELDNSNNSNAIEHANFVTGSAMVDQNGFAEKNISDAKLDSKIDIVEETMSEVSTVPLRANTKPSQSTGNSLCGTDLSAKF